MKTICNYYKGKFFKILVPTFAFIFMYCVFIYPTFLRDQPIVFFKFLTFTYNGNPGVNGIGATWYIFTLIPLYLFAPIFSFLTIKLEKNQSALLLATGVVVLVGFLYRVFAHKFCLDWYTMIYTPFYANIDLFLSGILFSALEKKIPDWFHKSLIKDFTLFAFLTLILVNSLLYEKYYFYQIICPTLYILCVGLSLLAFSDEVRTFKYDTLFEKVLNTLSGLTFEFYLFHSLVLSTILPAFKMQNILVLHFKLLIIGFSLTLICAIGFHRIFTSNKSTRVRQNA